MGSDPMHAPIDPAVGMPTDADVPETEAMTRVDRRRRAVALLGTLPLAPVAFPGASRAEEAGSAPSLRDGWILQPGDR